MRKAVVAVLYHHIRITNMERKMSKKGKYDRKKNRALRKGFQVNLEEKEGETYSTGAF